MNLESEFFIDEGENNVRIIKCIMKTQLVEYKGAGIKISHYCHYLL